MLFCKWYTLRRIVSNLKIERLVQEDEIIKQTNFTLVYFGAK